MSDPSVSRDLSRHLRADLRSEEEFPIGGAMVLRVSAAAAATLHRAADETGHLVVIECHRVAGGIGEAVLAVLAERGRSIRFTHLAVARMPRSGPPDVLYQEHGTSSDRIVCAVLAP